MTPASTRSFAVDIRPLFRDDPDIETMKGFGLDLSSYDQVKEQAQQGCAIMLEEISRLDAMVERLLYFARPLHLRLEPFDLAALAQECVEAKQALVRNDSIHVLCRSGDANVTVRGDRDKLRQVLDNILSNGVEALHSGGTVAVKVHAQDGFAIVECTDNGHGIPEDIRGRVFDPFFTTRANGTGLGLSIAYEIVQAHGGRIVVSPACDGGTIVSIHLPIEGSTALPDGMRKDG